MNMLYDLVKSTDGDWESIRDAFIHDTRIGSSHTEPAHKNGRGAGGHCFIKDFEAFRSMYEEKVKDKFGKEILDSMKNKNIELLVNSKKDLDLLEGVYGDVSKYKNS